MLTNNEILKKLRVALQLKDDDIIEILGLVDFKITKGALGDLFRAIDHPNYVDAGDQILRNFLNGLVIYNRGTSAPKKTPLSSEKIDRYQPNIVPKIHQKKDKVAYKPYVPKGQKIESKPSNSKPKFGSKDNPQKERRSSESSANTGKPSQSMATEKVVKDQSTFVKKSGDQSRLAKSVFKKDHFQN
jgi:hypothetical protein